MYSRSRIIRLVCIYLAAAVVGLLLAVVTIAKNHPFEVVGSSMEPTYHDGDIVNTIRDFSKEDLQRGDVVIFSYQDSYLIKRIIGMPGEVMQIKNGEILINHEPLQEYSYDDIKNPGMLIDEYSISSDGYICIGDNRNHSKDSRVFGEVKFEDICGIVKIQEKDVKGK